jgi:hypothetical protein
MTTAGHNFPVCAITPHKPTYAETMCSTCERQLHSRWVLIREWEHRWLHERGVCGCDVIFPGLLTTPRVIGETSTFDNNGQSQSGDDKDSSANYNTTDAAKGGQQQAQDSGAQSTQGDGNKTTRSAPGDQEIPPLFTEGVTSSGEHRVAVRLSSLYAAEWNADHRKLHEAGKCGCPTTFAPFQPHVREEEMTPHDRETLRQWREREGGEREKKNKVVDPTRDIDSQNGDTLRRIAEIEKVFGKFISEDGSETPKVNFPRATEAEGQGNGRQENNRFGEGPSRSHSQSQPLHSRGSSSSNATQGQGPLVPAPQIPTPFNPYAFATAQGYHYPLFPEPTPYPPSHWFMPAHPPYATAATYSNTIPSGAYPWAATTHQLTPGMPWIAQGPGPYRTPGLFYDDMDFTGGAQYPQAAAQGQGHGHGQNQPSVPVVQGLLPAPEIVPAGDGNGKGKGKEKEVPAAALVFGYNNQTPLPLCGLPIGAGPEGTSHMPSWLGCPLRRSVSLGSLSRGEEEGVPGDAGERWEEHQDWAAAMEDDSDNVLAPTPPSPPQRCHSAAP